MKDTKIARLREEKKELGEEKEKEIEKLKVEKDNEIENLKGDVKTLN